MIVSLGPSFGRWITYDQIPQVMVDAMVSTEDKRFYMHPGIDPVGMARAAWVAVERRGSGRRLQGASTITQQVTRNIFLNNSYSFGRKIREMVLALAMERKFSKRQILELYLNKVYFGGGAYGIDAASRKFFGHPATTIDLPEAAIIAGLVKAPSSYSPTADAEADLTRRPVRVWTEVDKEIVQDDLYSRPGASSTVQIEGSVRPDSSVGSEYLVIQDPVDPSGTPSAFWNHFDLIAVGPVDVPGGCTVGRFNIVGVNFQRWLRVNTCMTRK